MTPDHVFADPTGKRWRGIRRFGALSTFVAAALSSVFVLSLLLVPVLPSLRSAKKKSSRAALSPLARTTLDRNAARSRYLMRAGRIDLLRHIAQDETKERARSVRERNAKPAGGRIVAAFYAGWQATGLHSLKAYANHLTHLMPEWLHLNADGSGLALSDWDPARVPQTRTVVNIARAAGVELHPILNNATKGTFDPKRVSLLLRSDERQQTLARTLCDWLLANKYQGINVDLENLHPDDYPRLPAFLSRLRAELAQKGLRVSVDLETGRENAGAIAAAADFVVLMAYDEHYASGEPGPIASSSWYYEALRQARERIPADKLVVGIGNYAYDWEVGGGHAAVLDHLSALALAREARDDLPPEKLITFDADAQNPTFDYVDEDDAPHEVWLLDAVTAFNQQRLAELAGVRGTALWVLGSEDPAIWWLMDKGQPTATNLPASALEHIRFPPNVVFQGEGEVLSVIATPDNGRRVIEVDPQTKLCTNEVWKSLPLPFIIKRSHYRPKTVALTFDDGPSEDYTDDILDLLRDAGVKATFFVIGENADRFPELVRRMWAEGHEIGNHTFSHPNLGLVSPRRARLELTATQRTVQSILGRSTMLFRPPYNADAEPVSADEVAPVLIASELGYLTIGELIDPQDWKLWKAGPHGQRIPRGAADIVAATLHDLGAIKGNVVLLHDGGGNRSQTIAALKQLIPRLKAQGVRFVTASELAGRTRDQVMPALGREDQLLAGVDRVMFEALFGFEAFVGVAFLVAIILGITRVLFMLPLAAIHRRRARRKAMSAEMAARVSVLIAAFNERVVIRRTISCVLESTYPDLEVIVVDDGSTDGTADEVDAAFAADPRVRVIRQQNTGKAGALNHGMQLAEGAILVCFDADTQVDRCCIERLVRHFADARVVAVAGNVKVGNATNMLTRWQAIEYITSQNLDREAYSLLNAVSVVPGAVGAWRKDAVLAAGGYQTDTLAEDMDLTWRLREHGGRIETEHQAIAWTEAPDNLRSFAKQRFRWTYGTLQCLWKHRRSLCHHGWFGWLALPTLWLFQIVFQVAAPLVDLQMLVLLGQFAFSWITRGVYQGDWQPFGQAQEDLSNAAFFYALFFVVDLLAALVAFRMDRERPGMLWRLFWQRFVYRQVMYLVLWRSLLRALRGLRQGWGKLERKGTVGANRS